MEAAAPCLPRDDSPSNSRAGGCKPRLWLTRPPKSGDGAPAVAERDDAPERAPRATGPPFEVEGEPRGRPEPPRPSAAEAKERADAHGRASRPSGGPEQRRRTSGGDRPPSAREGGEGE